MAMTPVESGMPITNISLDMTSRCVCACDFCFAQCDKPRQTSDITLEQGKKTIDWLFDPQTNGGAPHLEISFWGGEPLIRFDLIKQFVVYAEEKASKSGQTISFGGTTNAVLLTEEKFDFLDEHRCYFMLSIDGQKKHHDAHRPLATGGGSWDIAVKNAQKALERWPFLKVRMSYNAEYIDEFFADILCLYNIGFRDISYSPVSEGDWTEERLAELQNQLNLIHLWYLDKIHQGENLVLKSVTDTMNCAAHPMGDNAPCGAGRQYVGVSTEGALYPCVPGNTLVKVDDGKYRQIKELKVGDYVISHRGLQRRVTRTWSRKYTGYMYEIYPSNAKHYPIKFTPEHPIYTERGWVEAKDIKRSDVLLMNYHNFVSVTPEVAPDTIEILALLLSYLDHIYIINHEHILISYPIKLAHVDKIDAFIKKMWPHHEYFMKEDDDGAHFYSERLYNLIQLHFRENFLSDVILFGHPKNVKTFFDKLCEYCAKGNKIFIKTRNAGEVDRLRSVVLLQGYYPYITKNNGLWFYKKTPFYKKNKIKKMILPSYQAVPVAFVKKVWYNDDVHNIEVERDNSYTLHTMICHNCHRFNKMNDSRPWQDKETCIGHISEGITNQAFRSRFINWTVRNLPEGCKNCKAYSISCTGGCWATNYDLNGDIDRPTEPNCTGAKHIIDSINLFDPNQNNISSCTCYNACYLEGTPFMQNNVDNSGTSCVLNSESYHDAIEYVRLKQQIIELGEDLCD